MREGVRQGIAEGHLSKQIADDVILHCARKALNQIQNRFKIDLK